MALRYLVNKPNLNGRLARWILLLEQFDYTMGYKLSCMHKQANHLSRLSNNLGFYPLKDYLLDISLFAIDTLFLHGTTVLSNF